MLTIIVIVIIIIVIIALIYWFISSSSTNNNNPISPASPVSPASTTSPVHTGTKSGYTPFFDKSLVDKNKKGKLFDLCPCQEGLSCKRGICRKVLEEECIINKECASGYCLFGKCSSKPPNQSGSNICLNGQLMKYNGKTFEIINNWLDIEQILDIIDIPFEKEYYILTENMVYKTAEDNYYTVSIEDDIKFKQLFYYQDNLHALGQDGQIYVIYDTESLYWNPEAIYELHDYILINCKVNKVSVGQRLQDDDKTITLFLTQLHNQTDIITYLEKDKMWKHQDFTHVYYIGKWSDRVEIYKNKILFYFANKVIDKLTISNVYHDYIYTMDGLYLIDNNNVYHYLSKRGLKFPKLIYNSLKNNPSTPRNDQRVIHKILNTKNNIWLILDSVCL